MNTPSLYAGHGPESLEATPHGTVTFVGDGAPPVRRMEAVWVNSDETWIYGWYQHESGVVICPGTALARPDIGAARSRVPRAPNGSIDTAQVGLVWEDLGIILSAAAGEDQCATANPVYAGGLGGLSVAVDAGARGVYFVFDHYGGPSAQQGVAMARMDLADLDAPTGKAWKWSGGTWNSPGLGGAVDPSFSLAPDSDWTSATPDAFWGGSLHFNSALGIYVLLLNRAYTPARDSRGIYVSFARDLNAATWSWPVPLAGNLGRQVQVIGDFSTDREAGRMARLFVDGDSDYELEFRDLAPTIEDGRPWIAAVINRGLTGPDASGRLSLQVYGGRFGQAFRQTSLLCGGALATGTVYIGTDNQLDAEFPADDFMTLGAGALECQLRIGNGPEFPLTLFLNRPPQLTGALVQTWATGPETLVTLQGTRLAPTFTGNEVRVLCDGERIPSRVVSPAPVTGLVDGQSLVIAVASDEHHDRHCEATVLAESVGSDRLDFTVYAQNLR